jgi:predicted nucleic acid-binding protein
MVLLDTSVWIEFFKKNSKVNLRKIFEPSEIAICLPIYQEILQGIRNDPEFLIIKKSLEACYFLENPIPKEIFDEAITLYRISKRQGYTIRSSIDCLISAIAIRNNTLVVHKDRDFKTISKFSSLQEKNISEFLS